MEKGFVKILLGWNETVEYQNILVILEKVKWKCNSANKVAYEVVPGIASKWLRKSVRMKATFLAFHESPLVKVIPVPFPSQSGQKDGVYICIMPTLSCCLFTPTASALHWDALNRLCCTQKSRENHIISKGTDKRERELAKIHYCQFQKKNMVVGDVKRYTIPPTEYNLHFLYSVKVPPRWNTSMPWCVVK